MSKKSEAFIYPLVKALAAAHVAAESAYAANPEDGGACNFDSPYIQFPPRTSRKWVEAAAMTAGVALYPHWQIANRYLVGGLAGGQGNSRTRCAEAARNILREHGFSTGVHYQMD